MNRKLINPQSELRVLKTINLFVIKRVVDKQTRTYIHTIELFWSVFKR